MWRASELVAISSASLGRLSSEMGRHEGWGFFMSLPTTPALPVPLNCTLSFIRYVSGPVTLTLVQFSAISYSCESHGCLCHLLGIN